MSRARPVAAAAAALSLVAVAGCATVIAGGPDHLPIATNPPGAYVYLNGQVVGQTPMVVPLDRHTDGQIQIYLPGFQPLLIERSKSLNVWTVGNLLLGILPVVVDLITADFWAYDTTPISLGLTPAAPGMPNAPPGPLPQPAAAPPGGYVAPQPIPPAPPP